MEAAKKAHLRELLFRVSVALKGLDALLELVGGAALWVVSPGRIVQWTRLLTQGEISEDPHDLVANFLRHGAGRLSLSGEHFMALYLLVHGVVKGVAVWALLRDKLWAYPMAIVVFGGFIAYQVYWFTLTGGMGLVVLTVFDAVVIWLIWLEYRAVKAKVEGR
ncbi:MAG TPA: DUF2127 domain-containing protein [Acidobacteriaceae bacterium]|nr:DUF2127 domain-containing protein [Acidobacteriaceae bacterium]